MRLPVYYKRGLPSNSLGEARVPLASLPPGSYELNIYRVGSGVNDVYTDYFKMASPPTLTREQVRALAECKDGRPVTTARVQLKAPGPFTRHLPLRENDLYLLTLLPAR